MSFKLYKWGKLHHTEVDIVRNDSHRSHKSIMCLNLGKLINLSALDFFHIFARANIKRLDQYKMKD